MSDEPVDRIVHQFSDRGPRGEIWRAFDLFIDTDEYLNLGYSGRYQTHVLGSPQRRLVDVVLAEFDRQSIAATDRVLDLGCGRGGPTRRVREVLGCAVVGIDLVRHNLLLARSTVDPDRGRPDYLQGDYRTLPLADGAVSHATAIDTIAYVDDLVAVVTELASVLEPGGIAVVTDLLRRETSPVTRDALPPFEDAWGFAPLRTESVYRDAIDSTPLVLERHNDLSCHSVRRFRRWTSLYLKMIESPAGPVVESLLERYSLDHDRITETVRATHRALPALKHVKFVLRRIG